MILYELCSAYECYSALENITGTTYPYTTLLSRGFRGGGVFQQIVGIPMITNCPPLLADKFLYSHEMDFTQSLLLATKKQLASRFNFTYRHIDDVLSH